MACIFVDIDGTLIGGPSCEGRFALYLLKRRRLGPYQFARAAAFVPSSLPRYGRHVFKKNKAYLAGLAVEAVAELAGGFVDEVLVPRLRRRLIERLESHQRSGHAIVLLTGAPDFIARPLAERLGADDWCATKCVAEGGVYTARPPAAHPFGAAKLANARDICRRNGWDISQCWAYADSAYDLALLEEVGRPVAAYPKRALARIATERGWEVLTGGGGHAPARLSEASLRRSQAAPTDEAIKG
jgi:HAD superfamily phosphoserine phosphatase-like hydrolase